ncbi:Reverse transcriptase precursor [Phytophthora megakarya]|uniref:Reverse transcriptase n=1 Tax=Phytophthora megakarya TaxID=4795 RepID=A0A225V8V9_9STRA|nr:Reverse transcriptase precursor [Phytophthora megakarya]
MASRWAPKLWPDLYEEIDAEETRDAIGRCRAGKACGPDDLGNEWYMDHVDELVPILTSLYNDCMDTGVTPRSFVEAYIFSIAKGGDTSDFTRILARRFRKHIADMVHTTQYGFVPNRSIHAAIDLFVAATAQIQRG